MTINDSVLLNGEKVLFALRGLYASAGYRQYRMSKFEEYDFYAQNKDFLVSDQVITFTDTNGKLMALKPFLPRRMGRQIHKEIDPVLGKINTV